MPTLPKYVQINDLIKIDNSCSFIVKSVEVPKGGRRNAGFFLEHGQSSLFQVRGETSQTFPINLLKILLAKATVSSLEI